MSMNTQTGTERDLIEAHLDGNRDETIRKVSGLPWDLACRRLGPSATSAAGVLKHLIDVERRWFRHYLEAEPDVPHHSREDTPGGSFDIADDDSLGSLIAEYHLACADSRVIAARHQLDDQCARVVPWLGEQGERPSLRWIYLHMIEEVARHNGHLDIYRELLDGQVDTDD